MIETNINTNKIRKSSRSPVDYNRINQTVNDSIDLSFLSSNNSTNTNKMNSSYQIKSNLAYSNVKQFDTFSKITPRNLTLN